LLQEWLLAQVQLFGLLWNLKIICAFVNLLESVNMSDINNFTFSMALAKETKKDLQFKSETLNNRISTISDNLIINDMPIVQAILQVTRSKKDLKKLARAIDRIADIIEIHDQIQDRLKVIQLAEKDPNWFVSAFGDFTEEVETTISNILGD
jgi:hypothetical protein